MEPGDLFVVSVIAGMILLPLTGAVLSGLKGRPVMAAVGVVATLVASMGILADLGNTEPSLSGLGAMGALLVSGPLSLVAMLGAIATAKPDSWWWRNRYTPDRQALLARLLDQHSSPGDRE